MPDPGSPLFITVFVFLAFLLAGGWALFRPRPPRWWPRGGLRKLS